MNRRKFEWGSVLLVLGILVITPVLAALNVLVGPFAMLPYLAVAALAVFFALPLNWLLLLALAAAAVIAGMVEYFAHVSQSYWLPYLMGLLFALRALVERMKPRPFAERLQKAGAYMQRLKTVGRPQAASGPRWLTLLAVAYLLTGLFSTVVALPPFGQVVVAAKNYWFMWGVLLAIVWCPLPERTPRWFWNLVLIVAALQWPVAAYQRFVVAAKRVDAAAWDAVVGTFGGDPLSGGNSAAMALTICVAVAAVFWRMRERRMRPATGIALLLLCLLPIAMAEVKAAFIWLTMVFLMLFAQQIVKQPVRALLTLMFGAVLLVLVGLVYKSSLYESQGNLDLRQVYEKQIKYAVDPNEYRSDLGRLGRVAALVFWWQRHDIAADPLHVFIGHGLGSSRGVSFLGMGEVARKYKVSLDTTGASTLLWDTGLLGLGAFVSLLVCGAATGLRQSRNAGLTDQQRETSFLSGTLLAMCALGVFYNRDAIDTAVVQLLVYFSLGQILLTQRFAMPAQAEAAKPTLRGRQVRRPLGA